MSAPYRFRAFWPTVMTVPAVVILVSLGLWQLERKVEKEVLLATIEQGLAAPPVALPERIRNPGAWAYRPVTVSGEFDHSRELYLYAPNREGAAGYHVITPLARAGAGTVLVNRGWVPPEYKDPATRPEGQIRGPVVISGVARPSRAAGLFTPAPEPENRLWFSADLESMAEVVGGDVLPVLVDADATPNPGGFPVGGQTRIDIPNNHLDYALTWFGLAVALLVIYVVYLRRRR
ncbi:MAG: SURF1 family protein [Alphaproteobacteria bacterium]|nr:MAG: SURF1 family protein [Alphaproteobacteria bacterium]